MTSHNAGSALSVGSDGSDGSVGSTGSVGSGKPSPGQLPHRIVFHGRTLVAIGNQELLHRPQTGLLCSRQCPAATILEACEKFKQWAADPGTTVVSSFHSPLEQECLRPLLKGKAGIIHCPAREIESYRIPREWKSALASGRMLIVSPFTQKRPNRQTIDLRNQLVASLAGHLYIPYANPAGNLMQLATQNRQQAGTTLPK